MDRCQRDAGERSGASARDHVHFSPRRHSKLRPDKPSHLLSDWDAGSDTYRLSLHRCQIALWTAIVMVIYISRVVGGINLPDIPENLLILMGISGGTYLGFNYPQQAWS